MSQEDMFMKLLDHYQANDWCRALDCEALMYPQFKRDITLIGAHRVIEGLGSLNWEQFDHYFAPVIAVFKCLFAEGLVQSDQDFSAIENSPAWRYFFGFGRQRQGRALRLGDLTVKDERSGQHEN